MRSLIFIILLSLLVFVQVSSKYKENKVGDFVLKKRQSHYFEAFKFDSLRNHPLLKHHFRKPLEQQLYKNHLEILNEKIVARQKQIEEQKRNEIYLNILANKIASSIRNDFLTMIYI